MKGLQIIVLFISSLMLISCTGEADKSEGNVELAQMKKPESELKKPSETSWEIADENCEDQLEKCSRVVVDFKFSENLSPEMQVAVASFFEQVAIATLQDHVNDSSTYNLMDLAEQFLLNYNMQQHDEYSGDLPWYAEFEGEVIEVNDKWTSVGLNESSFTGGAHGYYQSTIRSFNAGTQKPLSFEDLNTNKETLRNELEWIFRAKFNLGAEENLSDAGFWFKDNTFHLNNNFALRNDSLIFLYNPYEIAAYSEGIIELGMPLDKVQKAL